MPTDCMCKDRCRHGKTCNAMGKKGIWLQTQTMSCSAFDEIIEQTNEGWFCGLSTEEKARWLADNFGFVIYKVFMNNNSFEEQKIDYWESWLKEKHKA